MKKIINGKVYDTDKARELGTWANAGGWRDFNHCEETLYRKKTGEFFLHGEGGPMTRYAKAVDQNSWTGGERIMPMSYDEAREWAEEKLDASEYEEIFGEISEDSSRIQVGYSLSATTVETIKREAARRGITAGAYIEQLVAEAK
jgi:hypothetical protein